MYQKTRIYLVILMIIASPSVRCCLEKSEKMGTRTWVIEMRTGRLEHAGLDLNVLLKIRVGDEWTKDIELKHDGGNFKRGAITNYSVTTQSRGKLHGFQLEIIPDSYEDSWYVEAAKVEDAFDAAQRRVCVFNKWITNYKRKKLQFLAC